MIKMRKNQHGGTVHRVALHPVALTALIYLKEALLKERYEVCKDMISIALEFGVDEVEVKYLLEDPRRSPP